MADFNTATLPLAKEQVVVVINGTYTYDISTDVYDPLKAPNYAVLGSDTSVNKITVQYTEGVDFSFTNNQITFLTDDIFQNDYFVFKITDDEISRRNQLDGANLEIFKTEVQEEIDYIYETFNLFKEDILKSRVLVLEDSFFGKTSVPMPGTGQAPYWTGTDWGLFDVASVEEQKSILDDYVSQVLFVRLDDYVTDTIEPRIDNYVETVSKPAIDAYLISDVYPAIDNYVDTVSKPDIDAFANVKKNELQVLVDSAILDNGTIPAPPQDLHDLYYGYWWTDDISVYTSAPPNDLLQGQVQGQLSIKESDGQNAGSGSDPVAPRTKATYIFRTVGGITLYQIQTDETIFTDWMPIGDSASVIPVTNTDTITFPTGIMRAVYWTGTTWELAYGDMSAVGIAVRMDANTINIYLEGTIIIDGSDLDLDGNPYADHEYYFLTNTLSDAGKLDIDKTTTGVFQTLGRVYTIPGSSVKYFKVEVECPEDITPIVYTDQGETQIVLRPTFDEATGYEDFATAIGGYRKWNDGRYEEWGYTSYETNAVVTLAMPLVSFTQPLLSSGGTNMNYWFFSETATGFSIGHDGGGSRYIKWEIKGFWK